MRLEEGKLFLTEEELTYVKRASVLQAGPTNAGLFLRSYVKNNNLVEDVEHLPDVHFYIECILAYRHKNYEVE